MQPQPGGEQVMTHAMYLRRLRKWRQALLYRLVIKRPPSQSLSQLSPFLAQIRGEHCPRPLDNTTGSSSTTTTNKPSLSPMEIPGQYQTCMGAPHSEVSERGGGVVGVGVVVVVVEVVVSRSGEL